MKSNKDFKKKKKLKKFKTISALIAVVLLIAVAVMLTTLVLNFSKTFTDEKLISFDEITRDYKACDYSINVNIDVVSDRTIRIRHTYSEPLNLIGYSIISLNDEYNLNKYIDFDEEEIINIPTGMTRTLSVACFPEREFNIELIFDDNCRVLKTIKSIDFENEFCKIPLNLLEVPEINEDGFYEIWYLEHLAYIDTNSATLDANYY
jgi:hypothetical protein